MSLPVSIADVRAAHARIRPFVHHTPVVTCAALDERAGARIFFKCENLQRVGAFKARGATNRVAQLTDDERTRGVITHSSGNHAQALALAARLHDVRATIVMPDNAPQVKKDATAGYGAEIHFCKPTLRSREETLRAFQSESGAIEVHPYDDSRIIAGAGTAALELIDEVGDLDAVLAPIGGGGLLSGTVVACAAAGVAVLGCEPAGADDAYRGLTTGNRVTSHTPDTAADGLLTCVGELPFAILRSHEIRILRVEEAELLDAMRWVWERAKLLIEPSSAVAVAPLLQRAAGLEGRRVGVILSGGNVDASAYFDTLAR